MVHHSTVFYSVIVLLHKQQLWLLKQLFKIVLNVFAIMDTLWIYTALQELKLVFAHLLKDWIKLQLQVNYIVVPQMPQYLVLCVDVIQHRLILKSMLVYRILIQWLGLVFYHQHVQLLIMLHLKELVDLILSHVFATLDLLDLFQLMHQDH